MIITISGNIGAGKTTTGKLLAERLQYTFHSVGNYRRHLAAKRGISLAEFNRLGESDNFTDKNADDWQKNLRENYDNFVIDSRLGFHFIPDSLKIFLDVEEETGVIRMLNQKREDEKFSNLKQAIEFCRQRKQSDIKRYEKYYGINPYDFGHYNLVIDTTYLPKENVVGIICRFL